MISKIIRMPMSSDLKLSISLFNSNVLAILFKLHPNEWRKNVFIDNFHDNISSTSLTNVELTVSKSIISKKAY